MKCRFIPIQTNDCFTNMAIDEVLLSSKIPALRLYQWKPAAVSIGYNQNVEKELNLNFCKENNIPIVRRVTGGKAVFHDQELTYCFVVPEKLNLVPKDVTESYKVIAQALISALKKVGINAEIKQQPDRIATPICFNSSNWYELLVNGKKISGSAQRRMNGMLLQHGSILLDFDPKINSKIFKTENEEETNEQLEKNITSITNEIKSTSLQELENAMKDSFQEEFNFEMKTNLLNDSENQKIEEIKKKYQNEF